MSPASAVKVPLIAMSAVVPFEGAMVAPPSTSTLPPSSIVLTMIVLLVKFSGGVNVGLPGSKVRTPATALPERKATAAAATARDRIFFIGFGIILFGVIVVMFFLEVVSISRLRLGLDVA